MYPRIKIHLHRLRENAERLTAYLAEKEIEIVAVTKVFGADSKVLQAYYDGGIRHFADARIQNLERIDPAFGKRMLLRIPMHSELSRLVKAADSSLQSDMETLKRLNREARRQKKRHGFLLMIDLGDLREGVFDPEEMRTMADQILQLDSLDWLGTGTNLTCYGGVLPSPENLKSLSQLTQMLRQETGLALPVISAGNSSSLCLTASEDWIPGLNQLRIGEALALRTESAYGCRFINLHTDCFELEAEVIESRVKPSIPIGITGANAFGEMPTFEDRGDRVRLIVAIGRQDAEADDLVPYDARLDILGASSDHMILDAGNPEETGLETGDIVHFHMNYRAVLRAFTSEYVDRVYVQE